MPEPDSSLLDVEDEEQRQQRIGTLLEKLNVSTSTPPSSSTNPLQNITSDKLHRIDPPSELLSRIEAFLPAIQASNEALAQENPENLDIENVGEDEEQYIEMNLGLGVFESKRPKAGSGSGSEDALSSSSSEASNSSEDDNDDDEYSSSSSDADDDSSSSSSDDDSDSDSDSDSGSSAEMIPVSSRPMKPLPRRVSQQAKIEVLSSHSAPSADADVT
ncbi:hypothetical protein HYDPIDRAFT_104540 [Hydnomerulius pinastri MD-312]|nr:hypothetical protein HYDPIDRAFT_104540 [Hydnomerulius pinastri MD-312]